MLVEFILPLNYLQGFENINRRGGGRPAVGGGSRPVRPLSSYYFHCRPGLGNSLHHLRWGQLLAFRSREVRRLPGAQGRGTRFYGWGSGPPPEVRKRLRVEVRGSHPSTKNVEGWGTRPPAVGPSAFGWQVVVRGIPGAQGRGTWGTRHSRRNSLLISGTRATRYRGRVS